MMKKIIDTGITNINEINSKSQNSTLYSKQFSKYVCVYAKNQSSIKTMYQIISTSLTKHLYTNPRVFKDELISLRNNLIITNSPTEGEIWDKALNGTQQELDEAIDFYDYIFISPPATLAHDVHRKIITNKNIEKTIIKIINACETRNKKVIAVSDAYYLDPSDQIAHKVFVNSKLLGGKRHRLFSYGEDQNDVLPDLHLRTTDEMLNEFAFLNDQSLIQKIVIDNAYEFANAIDNGIQPLRHGLYTPKIDGVEEKMRSKVFERAKEIYGGSIHEFVKARIDKELKAIIDNNYSVIY
jgi:DNA polymerase-3 subunit alpha (Gram-positive type)